MAQGLFTTQVISTSGLIPSLSAVSASGDQFVNTGYEFIYALNSEASDNVLTVAATKKCDAGTLHNIEETIGAGSTCFLGKFESRWYNNGSDKVTMTYTTASGLTLGVIQLI
jgi:hypothetical protein